MPPTSPATWLWSRRVLLRQGDLTQTGRDRELFAHALSAPLLFSRSLVLVLEKQ